MSDTRLQTSLDQVLSIPSVKAEHPNLHAGATDEIATLRAQLAEARELISEAKIEIGFTLHGNTQPSISTYDKLTAYLQKVTTA